MNPPAWAIPRICVRETSLAGRTLPAGSMLVFTPYVLHRRPDMYPEPHRFDPGRWLAPAAHRAAFLPFGAGATKCIGEEFGLAEATLVLASITARWNLSPEAGTRVSPAARAVLVPRAFPVRLSIRTSASPEGCSIDAVDATSRCYKLATVRLLLVGGCHGFS